MKLVRFSQNGHAPRLGCYVEQDQVLDLAASCTAFLAAQGVVRAAAIAEALFPQSTRGFLEGGAITQDMLTKMLHSSKAGEFEPVTAPAARVRLHAPINDPGKFICIGLNYKDHAAETGNPAPKEPPIFPKWNTAILDPDEPILRPRGEKRLDWEVELGVVIGKTARYVSKEQALEYVYGYTIINDASARDFQMITMQNGNTRNFIFDVRYLVSYLSQLMTLSPGDLIATGTPAGVGFSRKPPVTLQPGDTVRLEISGLGRLENTVMDA
jgi:acylpyruvate hydrolase